MPEVLARAIETVLPAVSQARLQEQAYELLRAAILAGRFLPGQRLNVNHLAHELRVSPMPVRAALSRLAADGLVDIQPRRGTFVARFGAADVREVFQLRRIIECAALERLDRLTDSVVAEMERIVAESASLIDGQRFRDYARYVGLDASFHRLIVGLLGNGRASEIHEGLRWPLQLTRVVSGTEHHRAPAAVEEHTAILRALKDRDAARAKEAVLCHLANSESDLLGRLA
ncbi:MAG: GntR family transcriptional regulator [Anaerolineae bacterium]